MLFRIIVVLYMNYMVLNGTVLYSILCDARLKKNCHPHETTEMPCLPPQPPTKNVVIGSAEHHQQKWLMEGT